MADRVRRKPTQSCRRAAAVNGEEGGLGDACYGGSDRPTQCIGIGYGIRHSAIHLYRCWDDSSDGGRNMGITLIEDMLRKAGSLSGGRPITGSERTPKKNEAK